MKLRITVIVAALLAAAAFVRAGNSPARQAVGEMRPPWQVGACYRAYLDDDKPPHLVKVLEAGDTAWIRIEPQPTGPRIPGAREREPMWMNTAELFASQETPCPSAVGR